MSNGALLSAYLCTPARIFSRTNACGIAANLASPMGNWKRPDSLNAAPGVYSARFAGPDTSNEDNNHLLLERVLIYLANPAYGGRLKER